MIHSLGPGLPGLWRSPVRRVEDASCAIAAGANLIGVIFAASKRQASREQATVTRWVTVGTWWCVRQEKGTHICDFMVMFNGI